MTQLNLLPDVKLEYLRTTRTKRLVIGISIVVAAASVITLLLLVSIVFVFQKTNLNDLNKDIKESNQKLSSIQDLDKVLTVQTQLGALPGLHSSKPVAGRLFGYLTQITPTKASITQLNVDYDQHTMIITGSADSLDTVNTFVDTLKFTTYQKVGSADTSTPKAFSDVVLGQFARNNGGATFTINLNYDETIYNSANQITLSVPKIISTRSATEQPTDLFKKEQ